MSKSVNGTVVSGMVLILVALATVSHFYSVAAQGGQPVLPMRLFGTVQVNGQNASAGVLLTASINQVVYATTTTTVTSGVVVYVIDVPGDDPNTQGIIEGGREGDTIVFFVEGIRANATIGWGSGAIIELNLAVITPTATPTVTPVTPTPITPVITPATPPPPVPIPEPFTIVLFGAGVAGLWALGAHSKVGRRR